MDGVFVPKNVYCFIVMRLLDIAMSGQVFTRRVPCYEILPREKAEGARIVTGGEMYLGQPEGVLVVVYRRISTRGRVDMPDDTD